MSINSYHRLFQLHAFHGYFQQEICRCLEFNADADTLRLLNRFRLLIRRQVNGIGLYTDSLQSAGQLLSYIEQATGQNAFCFEIRTNNPGFNLFTALPPDWVGQLLYHSSDSVTEDNAVLLNARLSANAGTACLGKVTLSFADILKTGTGGQPDVNFKISFQARATQWQYFIVNRNQVPLNDPFIGGKEAIPFEGPVSVQTIAGEKALLFTSGNKLLPLSEEVLYRFDLLNRISGTENKAGKATASKTIIKGLPNPDPQWIGQLANDQLCSPMYIYL